MGVTLGTMIERKRKELRIYKRKMAEQINVSVSYINMIEEGIREPQAYVLARIAAILKCPLADLLDAQLKDELDSVESKIRTGKKLEIDELVPEIVRKATVPIERRLGVRNAAAMQETEKQRIAKKIAGEFDDSDGITFRELGGIRRRRDKKKEKGED